MLIPRALHPSGRTLLSYLDGELPAGERRELARHLRECDSCRTELDTIESDLDWHLVLDAALLPYYEAPASEVLQRVLSESREWRQQQPASIPQAPAATESLHTLENRVREAIAYFLGESAAQALLPNDGERADALLAALLGPRAAAVLLEEIRNRKKLDRFLAPDLT